MTDATGLTDEEALETMRRACDGAFTWDSPENVDAHAVEECVMLLRQESHEALTAASKLRAWWMRRATE